MDLPLFRRFAPQAPPDDRSGVVGDHHSDFQPRVPPGDPSGHGGQWTKGGGTAETRKGFLAPLPAAASVSPAGGIAAELSAALSRLIAAGAARATLLGGLLIPTNRMHIESGEVPGSEHVRYHYDEGFLTLSRLGPTGETEILFHGHHQPDGSFINADGDALARDMGCGVFIDGNAVRALDLRTATRGYARQTTNDNNARTATNDNVQFCPDVWPDAHSNDRIRWRMYQYQITGLKPGLAVTLNGIRFDGCSEDRKVLLEAKGDNYAWTIDGDDFFAKYQGRAGIVVQMLSQSSAARGRTIEWHIAESGAADVMRKIADELGISNIVVKHTPPDYRTPVRVK